MLLPNQSLCTPMWAQQHTHSTADAPLDDGDNNAKGSGSADLADADSHSSVAAGDAIHSLLVFYFYGWLGHVSRTVQNTWTQMPGGLAVQQQQQSTRHISRDAINGLPVSPPQEHTDYNNHNKKYHLCTTYARLFVVPSVACCCLIYREWSCGALPLVTCNPSTCTLLTKHPL